MSSSSSSSSETLTLTLAPSSSLLIPGLPNDISATILSSLPLPFHPRLRLVSRLWLSFLSPPSPLLPLRRLLRLHSHLLCLFPSDPSTTPPLLLDPLLSLPPLPLPPLPVDPNLYALSNFIPFFLFPHLLLLGGSRFDARSFPLNLPLPSRAAYRLDLTSSPSPRWARLPNMLTPRGSFACAADPRSNSLLVAGGGSRHAIFPSDSTRISSVESLDVASGEWRERGAMPGRRAGCVGFVRRGEFWVMGGYGEYVTVAGVVPADVYCRDAVAMDLGSGEWREVGDMWGEGERRKLGKVAVVEGVEGEEDPEVFMLDRNQIFR